MLIINVCKTFDVWYSQVIDASAANLLHTKVEGK